jgi:FkbM family methyltransferase
MKKLIQKILSRFVYQQDKYPSLDIKRRFRIINSCNIDTLIDIGANSGQYATKMRAYGYEKKIISFEPLKKAFDNLRKVSLNDNNWIINNYAIGNEDIKGVINVAGKSSCSSILNMLPMHLNSAPESKYIGQEVIEIRKLDSVINSFLTEEDIVMMKIDTQGYEKNVIDGASEFLNRVTIIQIEMSIVQLYENEMLFIDMINYLEDKGFQLFSLENGFSDLTTGRLLQVDGIFVKNSFSNKKITF